MGEVIAFRTRIKDAPNRAEPFNGDAQILFFLGVRYMRMEETPDAAGGWSPPDLGHTPRGGKKRKSRARA
ncbi:hypothetical protein LG047_17035 [Methylocystis sp. WRRC1]|uniref:hypothetical protein n=1 Tax=Methylocystis sp. WRRC1 TaxID=1732014 RepID=UPI001D1430EA|nr:hypothetical protein [Methylocystis sp. WRRC1]MCC3247002.1 hypothetical protein [Methylocystis sp. WRRC1]